MSGSEPSDEILRPAWSSQFSAETLQQIPSAGPIAEITREWAWGGSTGKGIRVAVIDSGIEHDPPAGGGSIRGGTIVEFDRRTKSQLRFNQDDRPADIFGHGTACAGIIHSIAPEAELYSVRVIGGVLPGEATQFAGGRRASSL